MMKTLLTLLISCLFMGPFAFAENMKKGEDEDPRVIQSGVIASFGKSPKAKAVNVSAEPRAAGNDAPSPIMASVRQIGKGRCAVKISNASDKSAYSVSYVVEGYDKNGKKAMSRSYSSRVSPKQTVGKELSCRPELSMQVVLRSGKRI